MMNASKIAIATTDTKQILDEKFSSLESKFALEIFRVAFVVRYEFAYAANFEEKPGSLQSNAT